MERVLQYLEIVPLPVLVSVVPVAILLFVLIPGRHRMSLFIALTAMWLTLGRMADLGTAQALAKATGGGMLAILFVSALMDPGPKRRLPMAAWMYPVIALYAFLFVMTVSDFLLAAVLRTQWLIMTLAALAVARTIVDETSLRRVISAITIGICLSTLIPFSHLLLDPGNAFRLGLGRFEPWGASSNQIGILFAYTAPLALYAAMQTPRKLMKVGYLGFCVLAMGMGLLTASRSTMVVMFVALIPLSFVILKRPIIAVPVVLVVLAGVGFLLTMSDDSNLERLGSFETGRPELAINYLTNTIAERPIMGLLETSGMSALLDESIGLHPHNAFVETLYLGGLALAIPVFTLVAWTMFATLTVWRARRAIYVDRLLLTLLCVLMLLVYAHGFVNGSIYYPTYMWAFFHIMLSSLMMAMASEITQGRPALLPSPEDDAEFEDEFEEYSEAAEPLPA